MRHRRAGELALARIARIRGLARIAVKRVRAERNRARVEPHLGAVGSDPQTRIDSRAMAGGQIDLRSDHRAGAAPQRDAVVQEDGQADVRMPVAVRRAALNGACRSDENCDRSHSGCERSQKLAQRFLPSGR